MYVTNNCKLKNERKCKPKLNLIARKIWMNIFDAIPSLAWMLEFSTLIWLNQYVYLSIRVSTYVSQRNKQTEKNRYYTEDSLISTSLINPILDLLLCFFGPNICTSWSITVIGMATHVDSSDNRPADYQVVAGGILIILRGQKSANVDT